MRRALLILPLVAACAPETPDSPDWLIHVRPILAANCIGCHGSPATGGAPATFRLDKRDDTPLGVGLLQVRGALALAPFMAARAEMGGHPFRGPKLSGRQVDILVAWADNPVFSARAGNSAPEVTIRDLPASVDDFADLNVEITDADRDLVHGELRSGDTVIGQLRAGTQTIVWDTRDLPPGPYPLTAYVDDDSARLTGGVMPISLGNLVVARTTATLPSMVFERPRADEIFADLPSNTPEAARHKIVLRVNNPNAMVKITAFDGVRPVELGTFTGTQLGDLVFETDKLVPAGPTWRLRASENATPSRIVESPTFIVSHTPTTETYRSVKSAILTACAPGHNDNVVKGYIFSDLQPADLLVLRGRMYRKLVQSREMPPPSASHVLEGYVFTEEARTLLGGWLLGGAPAQ